MRRLLVALLLVVPFAVAPLPQAIEIVDSDSDGDLADEVIMNWAQDSE